MLLRGSTGKELDMGPDSLNVPVSIALEKLEEDELERGETNVWMLSWSNYQPRRDIIAEDKSFVIYADNREELARIVGEKIVPLYKNALDQVMNIYAGTNNYLAWGTPRLYFTI